MSLITARFPVYSVCTHPPAGSSVRPPARLGSYNGQWLRDSFYGISGLWDVTNSTHQRDFGASAEWMFARARASDGIMPQCVRAQVRKCDGGKCH